MLNQLTIPQAAAAVAILTVSVCFIALLAGAFFAGCRRVSADKDDGFDPHADLPGHRDLALLAARAYQRQARHAPSSVPEVHRLRTGDCGLADRRPTVLPLPVRTRLDRASARYQQARMKRPVSPWGVDGGAA
jgi:hypothetical protein